MVEHYTKLQEKYNDLVGKHRSIIEGITEVKKATAKAGAKGHGSCFSKSLAAELSALRVEREKERELLKKENRSLRIQLRDITEAVHAVGELLARLREAEQSALVAERALLYESMEMNKLGTEDLRTIMKLDPGNRLARSAIRYQAFIVHPRKAEDLRGWASRTFFSDNGSTTIEIALKMAFHKFVFNHGIIWDHLKSNTAQSCIELKANKKTRNRAYDILVQTGHACVAMLLLCCFALLY